MMYEHTLFDSLYRDILQSFKDNDVLTHKSVTLYAIIKALFH